MFNINSIGNNFIKKELLLQEKTQLRKEMLLKRGELSLLFPGAAVAVKDHVLHFLRTSSFSFSAKIAGYWPIGSELDVCPLLYALEQAGFRCALPVVEPNNPVLQFKIWTSGTCLVPGEKGAWIPQNEAFLTELDILLLPLVAFDLKGNRLGRGGGYYDQTLKNDWAQKRKKPLFLGVAFSDQACTTIPHGPEDEKMDGIVTERGLHFFT